MDFIIQRRSVKLVNIYLLKVNNIGNIKRCEICSKSTMKTPERRI